MGVESSPPPPAIPAPLFQNHLSHIPKTSHEHNSISCLVCLAVHDSTQYIAKILYPEYAQTIFCVDFSQSNNICDY